MSRPKPPHWSNDIPGLTPQQAYALRQGADPKLSSLLKWSHHCRIVVEDGVVTVTQKDDGEADV